MTVVTEFKPGRQVEMKDETPVINGAYVATIDYVELAHEEGARVYFKESGTWEYAKYLALVEPDQTAQFKPGDKVRRKDGATFSDGKSESEVTSVEATLNDEGVRIRLTAGYWINPEALVLAHLFEPPWDDAPDWAEAYILDKDDNPFNRSGWYLKTTSGDYWINPDDSTDRWEVQPTAYKTAFPRPVTPAPEPTTSPFIPEVGTVCLYNDAEHGLMKTRILAHHPNRTAAWHEAVEGTFGGGTSHSTDDFALFRPPFTEEELAQQKVEQDREAMIKRLTQFIEKKLNQHYSIELLAEAVYEKFIKPI